MVHCTRSKLANHLRKLNHHLSRTQTGYTHQIQTSLASLQIQPLQIDRHNRLLFCTLPPCTLRDLTRHKVHKPQSLVRWTLVTGRDWEREWRGGAWYAKQVLSCLRPVGKLLELVICMWTLEYSPGVRFPQGLTGEHTSASLVFFPSVLFDDVVQFVQVRTRLFNYSPSSVISCHSGTHWNCSEVPWEFAGGFNQTTTVSETQKLSKVWMKLTF